MAKRRGSNDQPDEGTDDKAEETDEGHYETDETTGDRRWVPPKSDQ